MGWFNLRKLYSQKTKRLLLSSVSLFSIFFNLFSPLTAVVYAQEASPTPEPVVEQTGGEELTSPTTSPEVLPEVSEEPSTSIEPSVEPTPTTLGAETLDEAQVAESSAELSPSLEPVEEKVCLSDETITDTTNENWNINLEKEYSETKEKVTLGVKYIFPQENKVTLTFKCLPKDESLRTTLKIQKVKISELNLPEGTNPYGDYAYDITTGMKDGDFEYEVTLPKPEGEDAKVSYIEKTAEEVVNQTETLKEEEIKPVEEGKLNQEGDKVKVEGLDHFSIYFVLYPQTAATLNNQTHVEVVPGESITANLTVRTNVNYYGDNNDWESTGWKIGSGNWQCVDKPDYVDSGTYSYSFGINAPLQAGNYNVSFRAFNSNNCTGGHGSYSETTLYNGITVGILNPELENSCGLDIAFVIDNSGSISRDELNQMKTAFNQFVTALNGTPTEYSVTQFNTTASVVQNFPANISSALSSIETSWGYTNWEDGLVKAQNTLPHRANQDLIIFASDGNPNKYGNPAQPPLHWEDEAGAMNAALAAANDIKSSGTRIITLGIGIGNDLDSSNLIAISSADAYFSSDFGTLASTLEEIAGELCGGTITVQKLIDADGNLQTTNDQTPASGWQFDTSVTGGTSNPASGVTGVDGKINFDIDIDDGSASVNVQETVQAGYKYLNSSCVNQAGAPVGMPLPERVEAIPITQNDIITCTFINTSVPTTGTITIVKDSQPDSSQAFHFTYGSNPTPIGDFDLVDDGGDGSESKEFSFIPAGAYSWTEEPVSGWALDKISCDDNNSGANPTTAGRLDVNLEGGEHVTCTFTNKKIVSNVTICKADPSGATLSGWQVILRAINPLETVNVLPSNASKNGNETVSSSALAAGDYVLRASGTYIYRPNSPGAEYTDANYSKRLPSDSVYGGPYVPWVNVNNFPSPHTGWLGVMVNGSATNWSDVYNPDHIYALGYPNYSGGSFSFTILDDVYSDNSGVIPVEIYNGWTATTGVNGCVTFEDVDLGDYFVEEILQDGWAYDSGVGPVTIDEAQETFTLVNHELPKLGSISGYKFDDDDMDGTWDTSENKLSGWTINLLDSQDNLLNTFVTSGNGEYLFENLTAGNYKVCEVPQTGWVATTSECQDVVVTAGQTSYINFGNFQLGSVTGCKYNDINGDGDRDNEDFQIEGWTIRLYNSDWSLVAETQTIASSGGQIKYNFSNVMTNGIYYICEVMQPGWIQTDPVLGIEQSDVIANSSPNSAFEGPYCRVINNYQSNGYWYGERFGNIEVKLELTLAKENSVSGSTVTYTLTVENTGNQPLAVTVYDSLPGGFSYVAGSSKLDGAVISDPTNNSGLLSWNISLAKGEKKVLTYQATISGDLKDGTYTNQAYARGVFAIINNDLEIYSKSTESDLVSSQVSIVRGKSYGGNSTSIVTSVLGASTGQVLGASTGLPGTGSATWILLLAGLTGIFGVGLKVFSKKYEKN